MMNAKVLRVNASFRLEIGMYFTLDLGLAGLGFLSVGEDRVGSFVLVGFEGMGSLVKGVVLASFSSSSCF
jgi:hypothetical protein